MSPARSLRDAARPLCPKCSAYLRVNRDGTIRRHKIPRPPWGGPRRDYCPASGTDPSLWSLNTDERPA